MAKIFLSVVGITEYQATEYRLGNDSETNRFVQKSLLTMLSRKGEKFDRIVIFLTEAAKEKHWENRMVKKELRDGTFEEVLYEGLRPFLEANYPGIYSYMDIKLGNNEQEIFELFNTMYNAIGENDEITFDITYGFRFIPFLFFPLISYAKELKKVTIKNIYYGLLNGNKPSDIIDLQTYDEILDCANAAHNFIRSGNADEICSIVTAHIKKIPVEQKRNFGNVQQVASAMSELTTALLTCKGGTGRKGIKSRADQLQKKKERLNGNSGNEGVIFTDLIINAANSVIQLHNAETPYRMGMEAVKWYAERDLFLQAYTALRETITTLFCCIYAPDYDHAGDQIRKKVVDRVVTSFKNIFSEYDRMRLAVSVRENREFGGEKAAAVVVKAIKHVSPDKMRFIDEIVASRNYMNHFGMNKDDTIIKKDNLKNLIRSAEALIDDIESRKDEIVSDKKALEILDQFRNKKSGVFVNFSNHASEGWSDEQLKAAHDAFGSKIVDIPFPSVSAEISEIEIYDLAKKYADKILAQNPSAVMCMGEFGVCYKVVELLKKSKIKVVYTCSERHTEEIVTDSETKKISLFRFVKFREY